ncbi:MAG: hypothetical protein ABR599_10995 [Gemmatimonadota bacterium]
MTALLRNLFVLAALSLTFAALASRPAAAQERFTFSGVGLEDAGSSFAEAEIQVRVKDGAGGGYTRADYFDDQGRRLGFYEAFEVVSRDEAALRAWAVRNFPDRTGGGR